MFTENDINKINVDEFILKNQERFFGARKANPETICSNIAEGAMTLGCQDATIQHIEGWWLISSDTDWLSIPNKLNTDQSNVFSNMVGSPESGDNCFRWEYMAKVFSSALATFDGVNHTLLKGSESNLYQFNSIISKLHNKRIVGFIFAAGI